MLDSPVKVNRTVFLGAKLTPKENGALDDLCEEHNYVKSDFIRFAIRQVINSKRKKFPDVIKTHDCNAVIGVKLTTAESEELIAYCKEIKYKKSNFVRQCIILAMKNH